MISSQQGSLSLFLPVSCVSPIPCLLLWCPISMFLSNDHHVPWHDSLCIYPSGYECVMFTTTGWVLSTIPWFSWILNSWHNSWVIEAVTLFSGWLSFLHFLIIYVTVSSHPLIFPSLSPIFQPAYLLQCLFQIIYFSVLNVPFGYFPPSLSSSQLYSCFTLNILPLISTAY